MKQVSTALAFALLLGAGACKDNGGQSKDNHDHGDKAEQSAEQKPKADEKADNKAEKAEKAEKDDHGTHKHAKEGEQKQKKADLPEDLEGGETGHFGADFSIEGDPVALASVLKKEQTDEPVKVSATVKKVCKKKGCWFTLDSDDVEETIRVRMKDYGFFVPRNSDGGDAIVEGTLTKRKMSEKEAKHYAKDEGRDPAEISEEDLKVYEFTATAVEITKKKS